MDIKNFDLPLTTQALCAVVPTSACGAIARVDMLIALLSSTATARWASHVPRRATATAVAARGRTIRTHKAVLQAQQAAALPLNGGVPVSANDHDVDEIPHDEQRERKRVLHRRIFRVLLPFLVWDPCPLQVEDGERDADGGQRDFRVVQNDAQEPPAGMQDECMGERRKESERGGRRVRERERERERKRERE